MAEREGVGLIDRLTLVSRSKCESRTLLSIPTKLRRPADTERALQFIVRFYEE
jgi:hypothetical protein